MNVIDADGWYGAARRVPSPNCDARPEGIAVDLLVIHNISLPPGEFGSDHVERLFTNRLDPQAAPGYDALARLRVSAHFFIRRDGEVLQFVPLGLRAAHAGVSCWQGRERCNDFSLGIELEGTDLQPYTEAQYASLIPLVQALAAACPLRAVVGHNDIAPARKTDPGPFFDWARLHAALPQL
ncbi:AmpD protein [Andreprevotia lacus DSM 23236]|jgi:AmpD protein|uniref:1,6-anhydro-N-acetylmuramyl-L-alanine amidase AmpD n=1 Tax=Andreprevotia lacus DSM 23236 TaxID=1121001 RepID=A0A1W1Y0R8_9NEIS|nr:1,6-anhydro-N-acetylmuramyl-L-alanine amidase AmpD [Andreprevotia lacus]SMC29725.1 AmpD protein [Andreprevotia lacus DSM 23236]